jgi:hypothetical protein
MMISMYIYLAPIHFNKPNEQIGLCTERIDMDGATPTLASSAFVDNGWLSAVFVYSPRITTGKHEEGKGL